MPTIQNGRVSNDGSGTVSFTYGGQTTVPSTTGPTTTLTVTGNSEGDGLPIFLSQNANVGNVILNFSSIAAGSNVTLDNTTSPGTIIINASGGGGGGGVTKFIQLTDGPEVYSAGSILYSTSNSVNWSVAPSSANVVLYWTGSNFSWISAVSSVALSSTTLALSGNNPITNSGTITVNLSSVATAGTYTQVVIDQYGRVTHGANPSTSGLTNVGLTSPNSSLSISNSPLTTNGTFTIDLPSVATAGSYTQVNVDQFGRVTHGTYNPAVVNVTSTLNTISVSNSPINVNGTINVDLPSVVSAGTYTSVFVNRYGIVTSGSTAAGSGSVTNVGVSTTTLLLGGTNPVTTAGTFSVDLPSVVTAGSYTQVTVDKYGRVVGGTYNGGSVGSGTVTSVTIANQDNLISITGTNPITSSGTINVNLVTITTAGTFSLVTVDTYGRVTAGQAIDYAHLPTEVQVSLYPFSFPGNPATSIDIVVPVVQSMTIPVGSGTLTNSAGYCITQATSDYTFNLSYIRAGTTTAIGSITFPGTTGSGGSNTATITASGSSVSLVAGDILLMQTAGSTDATLANVGITIYALKV